MLLKTLRILQENTIVGVSFFIKNRLQLRCFFVKFAKLLRIPISRTSANHCLYILRMVADDDNRWWWIVFVVWLTTKEAFSLISSWDHCQRSSPSRIFDTLWAGFEPVQRPCSGLVGWRCTVAITTTPRHHEVVNEHVYEVAFWT